MFDFIRADILRFHRNGSALTPLNVMRLLIKNYGLQALVIYRFGRWRERLREAGGARCLLAALLYPAYWLLTGYVRMAYDIRLERSADIAPGLYIGHFGGIRVHHCHIGPCCAIQQQVQIGPAAPGSGVPRIGSGVWIGAHARIQADIEIGDGATIGAGAVVLQEVPAKTLVLGNPGRVMQRDYDNRSFL